jgi:hypothetical protein
VFGPSNADPSSSGGQPEFEQTPGDKTELKSLHNPLSSRQWLHSADHVLPTRKAANEIMRLHFQHAYIHWIDRLQFMKWYQSTWTREDEPESLIEEQIQYANFNIMCAMVYQTEPNGLAQNQKQLAQTHYHRAQRLLHLNVLDLNRLDLLFTMLLSCQWFQSVNQIRQCRATVGLCITIAHNLGLHNPCTIESLPTQRQQQMARRAWHGVILIDRISAMTSAQPLQITQDLATSSPLFDAIDDEFLSNEKAPNTQPLEQPSFLLFFLEFCRLHLILGDVLVRLQDIRYDGRLDLDFNHIVEIDSNLERFHRSLAPELRVQRDKQNQLICTGQSVHLHARFLHIRILLYRTFFIQAAENAKKSEAVTSAFAEAVILQGLLVCVRTAQEILDLIDQSTKAEQQGQRIAPQWYHCVTYIFFAVTVLIAAQKFPTLVTVFDSNVDDSIRQALAVLSYYGKTHQSAERCRAALTALYKQPTAEQSSDTVPAEGEFEAENLSQQLHQTDHATASPVFDWDFEGLPDLIEGEGMEWLMFNPNVFD